MEQRCRPVCVDLSSSLDTSEGAKELPWGETFPLSAVCSEQQRTTAVMQFVFRNFRWDGNVKVMASGRIVRVLSTASHWLKSSSERSQRPLIG